MKKLLVLGILSLYFSNSFAQEERQIPFSVAISAHIVKYNQKIDLAYKDKDLERAEFLFDSLVTNHLSGTYMDNFNVYPLKGDPILLRDYEKPIFLITYASWCVPGIGEIPALNDLADRFHDQIDFVVLFWDNKEKLKEKVKEYNSNIHLVHIDEKTNQDSYIINKLKHALGFPMMYFMDGNKKILDIRKIVTHHSSETLSNSYNIHFNSLSKGVSLLIADLDLNTEINNTEAEAKENEDGRTDEERNIDEEYERYKRERDSISNKKDN
ncbi:thiol-disulfide isomerase/thioredoxin [Aquimarina sp. EL_43]|uniref:TlpA family protein disulfide reductase n=1 Tax=Aquimarina TaxID=290174 RepID=UPI000470B9D6|nr:MULTISPECIES: redoxin domain-containing protein [Aquimarina]MBG6130533.1 thiol-disulfide isomerase/thioredoxin [Aquimarina sp. EL_35]MBG6151321.1 thiol-disulfide isomerase/thioredoxin [Aquimarina sp. EL_32]MBG6168935.1 thiol-disulfide isomerase/thioredoxin [Aquimarina sp. EL_43]